MERHILIPHSNHKISTVIHVPTQYLNNKVENEKSFRLPLLIICHGFIGNKIGVNRLFVKTARKFCDNGFVVVRFDYLGAGESTGEYGENTIESFVNQTQSVIDYALKDDYIDEQQVVLLGHSLGGVVSLITSATDKRVKRLALWSPVLYPRSDIIRIVGSSVYEETIRIGEADFDGYTLKKPFFDSLTDIRPSQDLLKFKGDVFIAHGAADDVIPVEYADTYQKLFWTRSAGQADKEIIMHADHTYSYRHTSAEVINKTINWYIEKQNKKRIWSDWTI